DTPKAAADASVVAFLNTGADGGPDGATIVVRDRVGGTTEHLASAFEYALSGDGRFVAYASAVTSRVQGDHNAATDVFVYDGVQHRTERVSGAADGTEGDLDSSSPALSGDGRFVAFDSDATNLVPGDTNGASDVFVRDRVAGTIERVSLTADGGES